jgi:drug/metabolite transporter (DMT)-like permease
LHNQTKGIWLGLIGIVIFSLTLPATKLAVPIFGAIPSAFYRSTIAGIIAILYVAWKGWQPPSKKDYSSLAIIALLITIIFPISISIAMQTLPSAHGGIVLGISPLLTAFFATIRFGERPSFGFWIAALVGSGLVVIFSLIQSDGTLLIGDLALIIAAISASYGYAAAGNLSQKLGGPNVISWVMVGSLTINLPFTLFFLSQEGWSVPPLDSAHFVGWAALLFVSIFSAYIGNFFWYSGLALGGIAHVSQLQLLQPFFTLGFSELFLSEPFTLINLVFATAVLLIVFIGKKMPVSKQSLRRPLS